MSDVVCLIPARGGSRRVPRKNLVDLCGKPLVAWSVEAALEADVGEVYVSTDDDEIADVALKWGANVHERVPVAGEDCATAEDVLDDFTSVNGPTRILYAEPTWPLRTHAMIRGLHMAASYGNAYAVEHSGRRLWEQGRMCRDDFTPLLGCGMFIVQWAQRARGGALRLSDLRWDYAIMDGPPGWNIDVNEPHDLAAARDAMERRLRGTT